MAQSSLLPLVTRFCLVSWLVGAGSCFVRAAEEPSWTPEQIAFFQQEVRPILQDKCWKCHGAEKQRGELRLDSRAGILQGGELGSAVNLDDPATSQLLTAIRYEELEMPPDGRLPDEQIATIEKWVSQGLPWTPGEVPPEVK